MNPCQKYKERIALALVEGEPGRELKQHISTCAACAAYAEELKRVCSEHRQRATELPELEAPLRLNARVRDAITQGGSCCGLEISLRRLLQGAGIAAAAAVVIALLMRLAPSEPTSTPAVA